MAGKQNLQGIAEFPVRRSSHRANQERTICIVTENRAFGGFEVHTIALIATLVGAGYTIELVCCRAHRLLDEAAESPLWSGRVQVIHTPLSIGQDTDFHLRSNEWSAWLTQIRSNVLILAKANNGQGSVGFLRACRAHFSRVFFIEHLQEILPPRTTRRFLGVIPRGLGLWWYRRRIAKAIQPRFADHTVAVSDAVRDSLLALGAQAKNVTTVRNGIEWQTLARNQGKGDLLRKRLGIDPKTFVFGMLARLRPEKGIDIALNALNLLAARTTNDFRLVIAGQGSDRSELEALAAQLGVTSKVIFLGFVADPREVTSAFDSILFASRLEGLPLGLLEGMAAGCLPIVTRISGMPEAVSKPELGWVVDPESPQALADAMLAASELNSFELAGMRHRVVEHVRIHFDLADSMSRILGAFRL